MKLYWEALRRPSRHGWFRWLMTLLTLVAIGANVWAATRSLTSDDFGMWWIINALVVAYLVYYWFHTMAGSWIREDVEARGHNAPINTGTAAAFLNPPTTAIPIIASEDTSDPRMFAMMKAFETGEPVSIYQDDEGVWRDSITDAPLPVQDSDDNPTTPKETS